MTDERARVPLHTLPIGATFRVIKDGPIWTLEGWRNKQTAGTRCEQPSAYTERYFKQPVWAVAIPVASEAPL